MTGKRKPTKYPFACRSCGRQVEAPRHRREPGILYYGARGMCSPCYLQWRRAGKPPLDTFRHPARAKTYRFRHVVSVAHLPRELRHRAAEVAINMARARIESKGGTIERLDVERSDNTIVVSGTASYMRKDMEK